MKILFCINNLSGGGAEKLVFELSKRFSENNNNVSILILNNKNDKYSSLIKSNNISIINLENMNFFKKIYFLFFTLRTYDTLHLNLFPTFYLIAFIKLISRVFFLKFPRIFFTEHNTFNNRRKYKLLRPLEKLIYSQLDHIISISNSTQNNLIDWLNIRRKDKFSVIFNGIDLSIYPSIKKIDLSTIIPQFNSNDIILTVIGRLTDQKNQLFLVEVLNFLPEKYKLLIVGEGELYKKLTIKINELNLINRIFLLGYRNDVPSIIKASNLILIPSKWEGFGLIAVESLACGVNILYSDVAGLKEILDGVAYPSNINIKPSSYAEKILSIDFKNYNKEILIERSKDYSIVKMYQNYNELFKNN